MPFVAPVTSQGRRVRQSGRSSRRGLSRAATIRRPSLVLVLATACALAVRAEEPAEIVDPFSGIEEMVVIGSGAEVLLQAQEISAIEFDADYLQAMGATDLSDIAQFTPNLDIRTPFAASNPTLFIRGVGLRDFNANSSSSVAVYNDEIYMNSPAGQLSQLFDVENIDVLRGPQATMYGRNASAGTIRVLSRKPTGEPGASLQATYGRFNDLRLEGALETPLWTDTLSMRTSFRVNRRDGFTRNRCADPRFNTRPTGPGSSPFVNRATRVFDACFNSFAGGLGWVVGQVPPVQDWVNDVANWGARTLLRYQDEVPGADLDFIWRFHGGQNRGDSRQFQMIGAKQLTREVVPDNRISLDANGYVDPDNQRRAPTGGPFLKIGDPFDGNPYEGDYNNVEKERLDLFGTNIAGTIDLDQYTITTVTGYEWNERHVELNLDGNPYRGLEPILTNESYQLTQELRLDYDAEESFRWQLGGMFLYEGLEVYNQFVLGIAINGVDQRYSFFTRYGAGWANAAWEPSETFKIEGGLRLNYEDKELNLETQELSGVNGQPVGASRPAYAAAKEFGLAGDLRATWSPIEDVHYYLRYAHGWKGPHINGGVLNPNQTSQSGESLVTPVDPEQVDSFEAGMKAQFWESRITANSAIFYYDYKDLQVFQLLNTNSAPVQQLISADDADVLGIEVEFDIKPFEGWGPALLDQLWIHTTFAWLDSKYTDFVNTQTVQGDIDGEVFTLREDLTGNQLVNSPNYAFIGFVAWPLGGDWGALIPRLDWTFKDTVYFAPSNSDLLKQDPLWLFNFRLTYKAPSENFELAAWVENLTDQAYTLDVINLARLRSAILHAVGEPRLYGVTATMRF